MSHLNEQCAVCGTGHSTRKWGTHRKLHLSEGKDLMVGTSLFVDPKDVVDGVIQCLEEGGTRFICGRKYNVSS